MWARAVGKEVFCKCQNRFGHEEIRWKEKEILKT